MGRVEAGESVLHHAPEGHRPEQWTPVGGQRREMRVGVPPGEEGQAHQEAGERPGRADVHQRVPGGDAVADPDDRPERPEARAAGAG